MRAREDGATPSILGELCNPHPGGTMLFWIESQSTPVIALIVFSFTYLAAALIYCFVAAFSRRAVGHDLKEASPGTFTPLAVILGLLITFLAARVWTNFDRAEEYIGKEASSLKETILLADSLPPDVRQRVRQAVKSHLQFIDSVEWPALASGRASLQTLPMHLAEAMRAILSFKPKQINQQLAQSRAMVAIENAIESGRNVVRVSRAEIAPIQWAAVIVPAVMILLTIGLIHIHQRLVMAITMFIFSTGIATSLVLLMVYDRPFGPGGYVMSPVLLQEIMPD
jgi:hypothetical protein